jgi:hypothetical protein
MGGRILLLHKEDLVADMFWEEHMQKIRNPNIEIPAFAEAASRRQAKQILITEIQMIKTVSNIWRFGFVSCFACPPNMFFCRRGFRVSNF